jgi:hypothetical protein
MAREIRGWNTGQTVTAVQMTANTANLGSNDESMEQYLLPMVCRGLDNAVVTTLTCVFTQGTARASDITNTVYPFLPASSAGRWPAFIDIDGTNNSITLNSGIALVGFICATYTITPVTSGQEQYTISGQLVQVSQVGYNPALHVKLCAYDITGGTAILDFTIGNRDFDLQAVKMLRYGIPAGNVQLSNSAVASAVTGTTTYTVPTSVPSNLIESSAPTTGTPGTSATVNTSITRFKTNVLRWDEPDANGKLLAQKFPDRRIIATQEYVGLQSAIVARATVSWNNSGVNEQFNFAFLSPVSYFSNTYPGFFTFTGNQSIGWTLNTPVACSIFVNFFTTQVLGTTIPHRVQISASSNGSSITNFFAGSDTLLPTLSTGHEPAVGVSFNGIIADFGTGLEPLVGFGTGVIQDSNGVQSGIGTGLLANNLWDMTLIAVPIPPTFVI